MANELISTLVLVSSGIVIIGIGYITYKSNFYKKHQTPSCSLNSVNNKKSAILLVLTNNNYARKFLS
jgi:hypothetical protein